MRYVFILKCDKFSYMHIYKHVMQNLFIDSDVYFRNAKRFLPVFNPIRKIVELSGLFLINALLYATGKAIYLPPHAGLFSSFTMYIHDKPAQWVTMHKHV